MSTTTSRSIDDVDLASHDSFAEETPHWMFEILRHEDPVHWQEEPDGPGFWCITKYEDIERVHKDWETFSSETGGTSLEDLEPEHLEARKSMIDMDPPRHNQLRAIVNKGFTPRAVRAYEDYIRDLFRRILDDALAKGEFDFVEEVSAELPMRVFAELLGAPEEDRRHIIEMGDKILGVSDPELADPVELARHRHLPFSSPVSLEMFEYGRKLRDLRRAEPRDDIVTKLAFAEVDGVPLTDREYDVYFLLLATAGNETTRHTITHGMLALMEHPDQFERLRADPGLSATGAEEILRWATPVHHFRRTATKDVELRGRTIRRGDKVVTWFVSGNFDEEVFDRPHTFDVARHPNPHITFGPGGVHFCIGAHLAKLEVRIAFEELVPRLGHIELAGPVDRLRSNFFNGIKRMPVRVRAAEGAA
jgi:cytochrome P450